MKEPPTVALLGARQVGKTTLAGRVAESWKGKTTVFDLERSVIREALAAAPERMLGDQEGLVVLDEIQRLPVLLEVLRRTGPAPGARGTPLGF